MNDRELGRILADRFWFVEQELSAGQNVKDVLHSAKDELADKLEAWHNKQIEKARRMVARKHKRLEWLDVMLKPTVMKGKL